MNGIFQDLRYALRQWRKSPGFTAVAVVTLALGIGANALILSVINSVLLQPLHFPESDRVVRLQEHHDRAMNLTGATVRDVRERNHVFSQVAAYRIFSQNLADLGGAAPPEEIDTAFVSVDFLSLLRVQPAMGRGFSPAAFHQGSEEELLLSHGLWQRHFGSDPQIVGKRISLHGKPRVVVGVMPAGMSFPDKVQAWAPLTAERSIPQNRRAHLFTTIARLKPGVSRAMVDTDLQAIAAAIQEDNRGVDPGFKFSAQELKESLVGSVRPALLVLFGAVGFVLLIACANVANLLLSRTVARQREIAVRAALGAGRRRLMRQFLTESILLGAGGGILGCYLAIWGARLLIATYPEAVPRLQAPSFDLHLSLAIAGISLLAAVLFGTVPALQLSGVNLHVQLAEGGRTSSVSRHRLSSSLVIGEVALALVLLTGAGLLIRSLMLLRQLDPGYDTSKVLVASLTLPGASYPELDDWVRFVNAALERVRALPGVRTAAAAGALPLHPVAATNFEIEGHSYRPGEEPSAEVLTATPDYFDAMGIRLLAGRVFTAQDGPGRPTAVVISQSMARRYWPHEDPLGKKLVMKDWGDPLPGQIVGVVSDVKVDSLESQAQPAVYYSFAQFQQGTLTTYLIVRTSGAPSSLAAALRNQVWAVDAQQPVSVFTMDQVVSESLQRRQFLLTLLSSFAALALFLAVIGIYGVLAYSVGQRTREFGIRLALGARREEVLLLVVRQSLLMVAIGLAFGIAGALGLTRLLRGMLFEVSPADPLTFSLVAALLIVVALVASAVPALRATKVDPMRALRYE